MSNATAPLIGVLALQGDVREHRAMLERAGAETLPVRRPEELARVDGIVLPGGESTTMSKLARTFELLEPLREALHDGLPGFGTCAGMIMLADHIEDGVAGQETFGGLDVVVRRNAFGRQVDSFEADLEVTGFDSPFHAMFIRAPWVEKVGQASRWWPGCRSCTTASAPMPPPTPWVGSSRSDRGACSPRRSIPRSPGTPGSTRCSWTWSVKAVVEPVDTRRGVPIRK